MESITKPNLAFKLKTYVGLAKPGIIMGNMINTAAGFALASRGYIDFSLFFYTLVGIAFIIASGCVFNNYIDRDLDEKMSRTKNRALVRGIITPNKALCYAIILMALGSSILALYTNFLSLSIALFGLIVYVVLYTSMKYISVHGTLVGSIAGAVPPVVGYTAVTNQLDLCALILFAILVFWQMPHFFAISIYRFSDFKAAALPVLPVKKSIHSTKVQMVLYATFFVVSTSLLTVFGFTGLTTLVVLSGFGLYWLFLCFQGFNCKSDAFWAKKVFRFSLIIVLTLCVLLIVDAK